MLIGVLLAPVMLELVVRLYPGRLPPGIRATVSLHDLRLVTREQGPLGYSLRPGFDAHPLATSDMQVFHVTTRPAPWSHDQSVGFRDEFSEPTPPAWGIVIGDSFTMGWGVEVDDTFPRVAGRRLGRTLHNLGVPGYGPQQVIATLLEHGLGARPQVVVWLLNANDFDDAVKFADWVPGAPWFGRKAGWEHALNRYSAAYKLCRYLGRQISSERFWWRDAGGAGGAVDGERSYLFAPFWKSIMDLRREPIRRGLALTERELDRFAALAREHEFTAVLLAAPYREQVWYEEYRQVDPTTEALEVHQAAYTCALDYARGCGLEVLYLLPVLRARKAELSYLWEDPHWSVAGHRIVGEALAERLGSMASLESARPSPQRR